MVHSPNFPVDPHHLGNPTGLVTQSGWHVLATAHLDDVTQEESDGALGARDLRRLSQVQLQQRLGDLFKIDYRCCFAFCIF